jgi:hypothetical protein
MGRLAVKLHCEVLRGSAGDGGFTLPVVRESEEGENGESEAHATPRQDSLQDDIHMSL